VTGVSIALQLRRQEPAMTTGVTLRRANFQLPPVKNFDDEFEIVDTIGKGCDNATFVLTVVTIFFFFFFFFFLLAHTHHTQQQLWSSLLGDT
jgi:hypothetical protein